MAKGKRIRIRDDNVTAELTDELASSVEKALLSLAPGTTRLIESEMERIYKSAREDWPVRKKGSKRSRDKLQYGIDLDISNGSIYGFVKNSAEYAWAIKVGVESDSILPLGARVSNELLWKPTKRLADPIAKQIAQEIETLLKK